MKYSIYTVCLVSVFALANVSYAQEGTAPDTTNTGTNTKPQVRPIPAQNKEVRQNMMEKRAEIKEEVKEKREEAKANMAERRAEIKEEVKNKRVDNKINAVHLRFQATIERQEGIVARIESRLAKIKADGGNTTEAEKILSEAKGHITEAKTALENLKTVAGAGAATTTPQASFESLKAASAEIQKHLKASQDSLAKLVERMKAIKVKVNTQLKATTTKTN